MPVHHESIRIDTRASVRAQDVTGHVRDIVRTSGIVSGLVVVSVPHTTCAICVNENEAGLRADLQRMAKHILEPLAAAGGFAHDRVDDNARAHLAAVLIGHQTTLPVRDGSPVLGTWQSVLLVELDGPRARTLDVHVVGDDALGQDANRDSS
jgi:secondary thiamine-phosphate synthase enzyme